ncbi:hypothetical protein SAMN05660359_00197 [Geodermatophilus obscurus]|jgi:hypothetical protein|uniref:Uncharacterized protein n=1 Tax=Geodermatophilus obscurus TaxID=1861 RepID=A0A1I5CBI0_9ACTN|nr:hypothetical protein [Geodermatophilus obscurus]SFN84001.1 hypothetical protein SAMN05660359_00197 [Geodermatophilus obscurus]
MTSPQDTPDDGDAGDRSQPEGAVGVELGMSEEPGGTFEPEEDPDPDPGS